MCLCCTSLGLRVFTVIKSLISIHPTNLFSIRLHPAHESEDLSGLCSVKKQSLSYFQCILAAKLPVAQMRSSSCPVWLELPHVLVPAHTGDKQQCQLWLARPQHAGTCPCAPKETSLGSSKRPCSHFSSSSPGGEQWLNQIRFWFAKTPELFML